MKVDPSEVQGPAHARPLPCTCAFVLRNVPDQLEQKPVSETVGPQGDGSLPGDPGRAFSQNPVLVIGLDSIRTVPGFGGRLLSRSSALGSQPFAQEAQVTLTALPGPENTLAFNF